MSHDALDESRLTLAVSPDEGYLVASLDGKIDAAEDSFVVERHGYVVHLDGVCSASWRRRELQSEVACILLVDLDELEFFEHFYAALHLECF